MPPFADRDAVHARPPFAVLLGTNEVASAIAVRLCRAGWGVVLAQDPSLPVWRRGMAFHDALWGEDTPIDGVRADAVDGLLELLRVTMSQNAVAITRMGLTDLLPLGRFDLLVDARLHKYAATPDLRPFAAISVGLGPGFSAGLDCDVAIETRPDRLGLLVMRGPTTPPDGSPPPLGGHGEERFVRASAPGPWRTAFTIGMRVYRGQIVGRLGRASVAAPLDGFLRGLMRDDTDAPEGAKLVEIDPRNRWQARCRGLDDRGRVLAEAVGTAIRLVDDRALGRALAPTFPFSNGSP